MKYKILESINHVISYTMNLVRLEYTSNNNKPTPHKWLKIMIKILEIVRKIN